MNIKIRKAKIEEIEEVVKVTNDAFNVQYRKDKYELKYNEPAQALIDEFKSGKIKILIAVLDNKIIGAQRYTSASKKFVPFDNDETKFSIEITKLAVLPEYRNQGIGGKLIKAVEEQVRKEGCQLLVLECMLEKNLPPHYAKLGFQEYRNVEHGDHHDIYMFKKL